MRWVAALLLLVGGSESGALERRCPVHQVEVIFEDSKDAESVCSAAAAAFGFLRAQGFGTGFGLRARVVAPDSDRLGRNELGRFDPAAAEIVVRTYDDSVRRTGEAAPFGVPMDRGIYRSFIVHELAHAVAHHNFRIARPSVEAHEYIAYTTQLATMTPELRERVLRRYGLPGFANEHEITALYLAFDPAAFGVKAYRHFIERGGRAFLQRLLTDELEPCWFE